MFLWITANLPSNASKIEKFLKYVCNFKKMNCFEISSSGEFAVEVFLKCPVFTYIKVLQKHENF